LACGDYHLAAGAPAIDQGDPAEVPMELTTDGDGDDRVLAGSPGRTAIVDIGWDEWRAGQPASVVAATGCSATEPMDGGVDSGIVDGGPDMAAPDVGMAVPDMGAPDLGTDGAVDGGGDMGTPRSGGRCSAAHGAGGPAFAWAWVVLALFALRGRSSLAHAAPTVRAAGRSRSSGSAAGRSG
jgi:hypothetical protein